MGKILKKFLCVAMVILQSIMTSKCMVTGEAENFTAGARCTYNTVDAFVWLPYSVLKPLEDDKENKDQGLEATIEFRNELLSDLEKATVCIVKGARVWRGDDLEWYECPGYYHVKLGCPTTSWEEFDKWRRSSNNYKCYIKIAVAREYKNAKLVCECRCRCYEDAGGAVLWGQMGS